MTGQELFHALSFVDERYIAEAETAKLGARIPWVRVLSVAACLCILIVGAFALENIGYKGAESEAAPQAAPPAAPEAAPEAMPEAAPEEAPPMPEAAPEAAPEYAAEEKRPGELHEVPYVRLRVVKRLNEGGFEAVAEAAEEMEMDTQVKVSIKEGMEWNPDDVVEGAVFEAWDSAYDPERNILYVTQIQLVEE